MATDRTNRENTTGLGLFSFLFLAILLLNAIIFANLFLSAVQSQVAMLLIRVIIMSTVLAFLLANSAHHPEIRGQGWYFIIIGFGLLLIEPFTELIHHVGWTNYFLKGSDHETFHLSQEILCRLFGFFSLAYGFFLFYLFNYQVECFIKEPPASVL